jgi:hypothetical protein
VTSNKSNCSSLILKREASNSVIVPPVEGSDHETKEIYGYLQWRSLSCGGILTGVREATEYFNRFPTYFHFHPVFPSATGWQFAPCHPLQFTCALRHKHGCRRKTDRGLTSSLNLTFVGPCIVIYFYSKANQMHNFSILFYFETTLHVSDGLSVHRQQSKTVHTA